MRGTVPERVMRVAGRRPVAPAVERAAIVKGLAVLPAEGEGGS
jgi:hypothetical protein